MPYCPECGTPVNVSHKFCPNCGMKLEAIQPRGAVAPTTSIPPTTQPQPTTQPIQPPPQTYQSPASYTEQIKTIIPNLMLYKGWGRYDTFNLVVTDGRSIFSKLTNEMMSNTIKARRAKAEGEGKGFFGKWKAQMQGFNTYVDYYEGMTPDQILMDSKENYAIDNSSIRGLNVRDERGEEDMMSWYGLEILTTGKKITFRTQYDPTEAFNLAYGLQKR
jgi:hypothetical protein